MIQKEVVCHKLDVKRLHTGYRILAATVVGKKLRGVRIYFHIVDQKGTIEFLNPTPPEPDGKHLWI